MTRTLGLTMLLVTLLIGGYLFIQESKTSGPTAPAVTQAETQAQGAVAATNFQGMTSVLQAWYAANGTYAGAALPPGSGVALVRADAASYCLETIGSPQPPPCTKPGRTALLSPVPASTASACLGGGERSPAAELTHGPVPLDACRRYCDLAPDEPMGARADGPQKPEERRYLGDESHCAAHGRAGRNVLGPDQVRPLARDSHPAARITNDLDQPSPILRDESDSRTALRIPAWLSQVVVGDAA